MDFDRSRFVDREVLDPHRVMEMGPGAGPVGIHTEGNLDFLKKGEVDLGVRSHFFSLSLSLSSPLSLSGFRGTHSHTHMRRRRRTRPSYSPRPGA